MFSDHGFDHDDEAERLINNTKEFEEFWKNDNDDEGWSMEFSSVLYSTCGVVALTLLLIMCCCARRRRSRGIVLGPATTTTTVTTAAAAAAAYPQQQYVAAAAPYPVPSPYPVVQNVSVPYPSGYPQAAPYPGQGAPYPAQGAPYPGQGAPYPSQGAPYPSQGAPYPSAPSAPDANVMMGLAAPGWHPQALPPSYEAAMSSGKQLPYNPNASH